MAKEKHNNRQTWQSKRWLVEALLELMAEKEFQRITIQEIANHSQLDRRTFYRHFGTKEEVLDYYIDTLVSTYIESLDEEILRDDFALTQQHFTFLAQHLAFLRLLKYHHLFDRLLVSYSHYIQLFSEKFGLMATTSSDAPFAVAFKAGGFWNCVSLWLEEEPVRPPEQMAEVIVNFMKKGFS